MFTVVCKPCYANNGIHDADIEDNFISERTVKTVQQESYAVCTIAEVVIRFLLPT